MQLKPLIISLISLGACLCLQAQGFKSEDVRVLNKRASIYLAGTITVPSDSKPLAGVVLATGSGAQNRDEEILGHKPFKVLAEYLSDRGYAVLRMDDRGTGESQGDMKTAVTDDFATDIAAGLEELHKRYEGVPIGVIGHSEGGTIAIKQAVDNPQCDFIVTLAAPAWPGDSIIMSQGRAMAEGLLGKWDAEPKQREILDVVKSDLSDMQVRMSLSYLIPSLFGEAASLPQTQKAIAAQMDVVASPWYRGMVKYNPEEDIKSVVKPWLALNGDRDTQVLPANLSTIATLNAMADTQILPKHNHLFQRCTTGLVNEYATIGEDISPDALEAIGKWLDAQFKL